MEVPPSAHKTNRMTSPQKELTGHLTSKQLALFEENQPFLEDFVAKYKVTLLAVEESTENPDKEELMYFFNDNLGGYDIKAIKNSLDGKVYYL